MMRNREQVANAGWCRDQDSDSYSRTEKNTPNKPHNARTLLGRSEWEEWKRDDRGGGLGGGERWSGMSATPHKSVPMTKSAHRRRFALEMSNPSNLSPIQSNTCTHAGWAALVGWIQVAEDGRLQLVQMLPNSRPPEPFTSGSALATLPYGWKNQPSSESLINWAPVLTPFLSTLVLFFFPSFNTLAHTYAGTHTYTHFHV